MESRYSEVVDEIYELEKFRGKISLEPIQQLSSELGDPQEEFEAVHVAGTNGKGSTATMLAAALEAAGYRTGLFTSPHLTDFRERIQINGENISARAVIDHYRRIADTDVDISFFECMTAIAFQHFAQEEVDIAVIETGMGGRVDATNVVEPEVSVITNVAKEHTRWLGETPEQIAYEIAGIIEENVPVVSGVDGSPGEVVEAVADERGADLVPVEDRVTPLSAVPLVLEWDGETIETCVAGRYQAENVNTVLAALDELEREVPSEAVRTMLASVEMPGRMESMRKDPLLLLDGAHNPAAVAKLRETLSAVDSGKTVVVTSIMADKDYPAMLSTIEEIADLVILSEAEIDRAARPDELASHVDAVDSETIPSIPEALETAMRVAGKEGTVLVTGSLYFVGDVKKVMGTTP